MENNGIILESCKHIAKHGEAEHWHLYAIDSKTKEYIQDIRSPFYSKEEFRNYIYEHKLFNIYHKGIVPA